MAVTRRGQAARGVAALAAVALAGSLSRGRWLSEPDRVAFELVRARRGKSGTAVARAVSALAEPGVIYPAVALAGIQAARNTGWPRAIRPFLVVASGAAARKMLSQLIARPRPPQDAWLTQPEGFSLPSRHTAMAALAAGACARSAGAGGAASWSAAAAAAGVGASRVYLGVHWPGDVIAGWVFAEGWLRLTQAGRVTTAAATGRRPHGHGR